MPGQVLVVNVNYIGYCVVSGLMQSFPFTFLWKLYHRFIWECLVYQMIYALQMENNNKPWSDKTYAVSWDFKKTCCFVEYWNFYSSFCIFTEEVWDEVTTKEVEVGIDKVCTNLIVLPHLGIQEVGNTFLSV